MNVLIKKKGKTKIPYFYEGVWGPKDKKIFDDAKIEFKYPVKNKTPWKSKDLFVNKLERLERNLFKQKKFIPYKKSKSCLICSQKNISKGLYRMVSINWDDGLYHYIDEHNVKPSDEFMENIYSYYVGINKDGQSIRLPSLKYNDKDKKKYSKIDKNQLLIMDSLYRSGGFTKKYEDKKLGIDRYSEHVGLLRFNNGKLDQINVLGTTDRTDPKDNEIFMPKNTDEAYDYSYIFHTHPATPSAGGRAKTVGILYEFPSVSDIIHFVQHYSEGQTKGSIVIAPEGLYLIRKKNFNNKSFSNLEKFYDDKRSIHKKLLKINEIAIEKYPPPYKPEYFYSVIAQDRTFVELVNSVLNEYDLHINYQPRSKRNKEESDDKESNTSVDEEWIIDTIYVPM